MSERDGVPRFQHTIEVDEADIDGLGHVNNTVYVRWVQDVAGAHWRSAAAPEDVASVAWVVVRHEIDYKHPARLGERILARTWVGEASGLTFERNVELLRERDGKLLARARTLWCPVDAVTGKPRRVPDSVRERFSIPTRSSS